MFFISQNLKYVTYFFRVFFNSNFFNFNFWFLSTSTNTVPNRILKHKDLTFGHERKNNFEFQIQKLFKTTILNYILIFKIHFWNILEQQYVHRDY